MLLVTVSAIHVSIWPPSTNTCICHSRPSLRILPTSRRLYLITPTFPFTPFQHSSVCLCCPLSYRLLVFHFSDEITCTLLFVPLLMLNSHILVLLPILYSWLLQILYGMPSAMKIQSLEAAMREIMHQLCFWVWMILNTIFSSFIHLPEKFPIFFSILVNLFFDVKFNTMFSISSKISLEFFCAWY